MIKGTRNQLYNVNNASQGETKKVLTVCSAGLLRSATLQNMLIREYGYNARNCGTVESYALIPWANEIIFVNNENFQHVKEELEKLNVIHKCYVLDIPDMYEFNDPELVKICKEQYENKIQYLPK